MHRPSKLSQPKMSKFEAMVANCMIRGKKEPKRISQLDDVARKINIEIQSSGYKFEPFTPLLSTTKLYVINFKTITYRLFLIENESEIGFKSCYNRHFHGPQFLRMCDRDFADRIQASIWKLMNLGFRVHTTPEFICVRVKNTHPVDIAPFVRQFAEMCSVEQLIKEEFKSYFQDE